MKKLLPRAFSRFIVACALLMAIAVPCAANADPIVGDFSIAGSDTFDASSITFTNPAYVLTSSLPGFAFLQQVTLANFVDSSAAGPLFTTAGNGIVTTFTITSATATYTPAGPGVNKKIVVDGLATIGQTGYTDTLASFSLTSSSVGNSTSFQLVGDSPASVAPEPSSLVLLGTGLLCAAALLMRRHRNNAAKQSSNA